MSGFLSSFIGMGGMVVGGILGGLITGGNPAGIAVGASLGGMVFGFAGQYLLPGSNELSGNPPPQPHENRIQISTYGQSISLVYESARLAGNVIYMQPVQRTVNRSRHRQDGVRYYEYIITYTSTFAIAFCEGPQEGICRIWVNGNLFADWRDPAGPYYPSGSVGLAAGNLATSIARQTVYFTIYTGTETQTADTALSAILGAAETPSYKGICYIVFRDFPIGEFTGIPKIEVEIGPQVATDTCSEYFTGTNGSAPSEDVLINYYSFYVNDPTIQNDGLKFTYPTIRYYRTTFEYLGEYDFQISYTFDDYSSVPEIEEVYIEMKNSNTYIGFYIPEDKASPYYYAAGASDVNESSLTGKLRVRRDSSNNVYVYYWNTSLSRWEWDGDTDGLLTDTYSGADYPLIQCRVGDASMSFTIWDFVTNSGCDNTQPVGT